MKPVPGKRGFPDESAKMRNAFIAVLSLVLLLGTWHPRGHRTPKISILLPPVDSAGEIYFAQDLGFFAKQGLDVEMEPGSNGSAIAAAVSSDAVDIGYSDLVTLAKGYLKGIPFVAIAPAAIWTSAAPTAAIVVPMNSPVKSAKDLAGKVIAIPGLATLAEYSPRAWIDQNGGDSTTAKFTELNYSAMPAALDAGRIDAAYISEPYLAVVKKTTRIIGYSHNAVAKQFLQSAWFTTPQWAKDHADVVRRFAAAMRETAIWANQKSNQEKSAEILSKYTKVDLSTIQAMERVRFGETLSAGLIQPAIDVTGKYGNFQPFPADRLIFH